MRTGSEPSKSPDSDSLSLENLRLENRRLTLEVVRGERQPLWLLRWQSLVPLLTVIVAVSGLWLTFSQIRQQQEQFVTTLKEERVARQRALDTEREQLLTASKLQIKKPFWEKQLQLYLDAAEVAGIIASSRNAAKRTQAEARFWVLYWGPLTIVEDAGIEKPAEPVVARAMISLGDCLLAKPKCEEESLQRKALDLAYSCQDSIKATWDIQFANRPEDVQKMRGSQPSAANEPGPKQRPKS